MIRRGQRTSYQERLEVNERPEAGLLDLAGAQMVSDLPAAGLARHETRQCHDRVVQLHETLF